MTLSKLSIQKDSQVMRLCLSIAGVIAAIPLALGAKAPTPTTSPDPPTIKLASHTEAPRIPATISLRPLTAQNNSLIGDTVGTNLNTEQTTQDTAQKIPDKQGQALSTQQETRVATPEAAPPTAAAPNTTQTTPTKETPASGTDGDKASSSPTTTTPTTPKTQTVVTTTHRSSTEEATPSTSSDTTSKEGVQLSRTQLQTQAQAPALLRRLL